ncbi:GGDEF domain-containing protein [Longispora albida]|uniref:GGDEF domain-containing protein n=1 Tax=Longispora albida TaxID=203523 RepID=UPI000365DA09|nr:diguanylate cyclase [Longispora albida]
MTLRARLTAAFLVVVLGPLILGAVFVGGTVSSVGRSRSAERLEFAESAARVTLDALCQRLRATAEAAAALSQGGRSLVAQRLVMEGRAAGVRIVDVGGTTTDSAGSLPEPWAYCGAESTGHGEMKALVARVPVLDQSEQRLGEVIAAEPLDLAFLNRFGRATGAGVTLLDGRGLSTVPERLRGEVAPAVSRADGDTIETGGGLYVRMIRDARPLPLVLSVEHSDPHGLYAALLAVVISAGLVSVFAAWSLARSTTRPVSELAHAADRVAAGDLDARVPVRGGDEVGRLAATFNRMTKEMQGYVTALTASRDQLREAMRLSRTDPLTGLANYRHLEESLRLEVDRTSRLGLPLVIAVLDLDRFKEVNDSHGHPAGDAVLVEVARRLEREIREVDRAFRQGGEEFVLLLPETDLAGGVAVAERLGSALRDSAVLIEPSGIAIKVTVSIGLAVYPEHGETGTSVLAAADDALYAAKAAGRDTYAIARGGTPG